MEGPTADLRAHPLAPAVPLPFRHGLTLGELAGWMVRRSGLRVRVEVVECTGWDRLMGPHPRPTFSQTVWHLPELFCGLGVVAAAADWEWTAGPGAQLTLAGHSIDGDRLRELLLVPWGLALASGSSGSSGSHSTRRAWPGSGKRPHTAILVAETPPRAAC